MALSWITPAEDLVQNVFCSDRLAVVIDFYYIIPFTSRLYNPYTEDSDKAMIVAALADTAKILVK